MSFSAAPLKKSSDISQKQFDFLTLDQLEENTAKLEAGLEEKYKNKNKKVPQHRALQMEEIETTISDMRAMLSTFQPDVIGDKSEQATQSDLSRAQLAELNLAKTVTGAYLELKALIKGFINLGYLVNHIDETIGVTKDNPMDAQSEQDARGLYRYYKQQKQKIAEVKDLNRVKSISEELAYEIQNFNPQSLAKSKTRDPLAVVDELRTTERKKFTDESIKELDSKIVKQAKLVMKDVQGMVPEKTEASSFNPLNWFKRSVAPTTKQPVVQQNQPQNVQPEQPSSTPKMKM